VRQPFDSSTLLLDRPAGPTEPTELSFIDLAPVTTPPPRTEEPTAVNQRPPTAAGRVLQQPGLAMLAAVFIFAGYKWLGVIPADRSRLSLVLLGRPGAIVFAVLAIVAVAVLASPASPMRRSSTHLVLMASALIVVAATSIEVAGLRSLGSTALGVADLVLACAAIGALIAGERARRQTEDERSVHMMRGSDSRRAGLTGPSSSV
jgi:hypothetical protein